MISCKQVVNKFQGEHKSWIPREKNSYTRPVKISVIVLLVTGFSYSGVACTMSFFFILRQTSKKFFTKENQVMVKNSKCLFFFWEAGEWWVSFIALAFDFLWKSAQKVKEIKQNKLY